MATYKELRDRLVEALAGSTIGVAGIALASSPIVIGLTVAAGAVVTADSMVRSHLAAKRDGNLRHLLKAEGKSHYELSQLLHGGEGLLLAVCYEQGELTVHLLGHKDKTINARLKREGTLISIEEVRRRADHRVVEYFGF